MNIKEIKFSVLMSLYFKESEKYLHACFSSIYNQTLPCTELVCVYDGPLTDELEDVVTDWSKRLPIKVVRLTKNVGLGNALNEGLKHCSYDLVARMDTDDVCLDTRFEEQITYMAANPKTVLLGSSIYECASDINKITSIRKVPTENDDIIKFARLKNPFNHMTVMFNKSAIISVGGYKHHYFMEDYNLWLRVMAKSFPVANLDNSLVIVRAGANMLSRRSGISYLKSEYKLAKLKYTLHFQSLLPAIITFLIRGAPRILPLTLLSYIYKKSRASDH
ncbi:MULTISPECIES: glycosyltransferase [unclassified Serratia (in: enterobacteria)]|uniref:glycosyltransferase n=1 Tax=unclassified Serratia (in: enterobacteria) TaxID=2647522 RepID=UPI00307634B2